VKGEDIPTKSIQTPVP